MKIRFKGVKSLFFPSANCKRFF